MPEEDFDLDSLAAYLHLAPAQVARLADRAKLPGRKVAGQWRFSPAEIHHWLETRIGLSDEEDLDRIDSLLDRAAPDDEPELRLGDVLPEEAIEIPLSARSPGKVITAMTEVAARTGWLWDPPQMADAVRSREEMHPTALENGVALLHPRRPMPSILGQAFVAFGRAVQGVPFGGSRGVLTDLFFLILSVDDRGHLRTLARLTRLLNEPEFLTALREAPDAKGVREEVAKFEAEIE